MPLSCLVGVDSVQGEAYGSQADLSYRPNGGIDIQPGPFAMQVTEMASFVTQGATLVLTLGTTQDVVLDANETGQPSITNWLRVNAATMEVSTYQEGPAVDPETGYQVTLRRAGKPDLVGKCVGSIALAFAEAIKGA